jgi:hypothetical protein
MPNRSAAIRMPTGWLRPISATAMPMKPAPSTAFRISRSSEPSVLLSAMSPASPPEISMEIMMIRVGPMPRVARRPSEKPKARIS